MSVTENNEKKTASLQWVKTSNTRTLLNLIYRFGPISRAALTHTTRLSPATVSALTSELSEKGFIMELGVDTSTPSGRKPLLLDIRPEGGYIAGVELSEKGFSCGIYDLRCGMLDETSVPVEDFSDIGKHIIRYLTQWFAGRKLSARKLIGICVGVPSFIDRSAGVISGSTVLPAETDVSFFKKIKQKFPWARCELENESSLYAYAERVFGADGNVSDLLFIDIGTGIGSGLILDGRMYTGSLGLAGEVGHMTIDVNGPRCKCGNKGCLEVLASLPAITQRIIFGMISGRETYMAELCGQDYHRIDIHMICKAMSADDALTLEALEEAARMLAVGIGNLINILSPQVVVIGGDITALGDRYLAMVRAFLDSTLPPPGRGRVEVRYTNVAGNMVTLGGAHYVIDLLYGEERTVE